jgi:Chaperone of endosialidase
LSALASNTTGSENTATGLQALFHNIVGNQNTATGKNALFHTTNGASNTADGYQALFSNTGGANTAVGFEALYGNTTGVNNTAVGIGALDSNTVGSANVALGRFAGDNATTGSNNVYLGANMNGVASESNACYIASIYNQLSSNGTQVFVNSNGKLGTTPSSRRFKDNIRPMAEASDVILALKPVTFNYKKDPAGIPQFGLVAEDVEAVNPDLVVRDNEGQANSVRYDAINAMLLNEFLKEHQEVEKLEATVADLVAELRQVKAQVQTNSPVLRVAARSP